jgi:hypothetical protein
MFDCAGIHDILGAAGRWHPPVKLWIHYKENYMKRLLGLLLALTVMVSMTTVPSFGQDKKTEKTEKKGDKKAADKKADKGDKKGDAKKKAAKKSDDKK